MEQRLVAHMDRNLQGLESRVGGKISKLTSSVDRYLKRTEDWHQEHAVLKARYDRLGNVLAHKGIVSEEELALS